MYKVPNILYIYTLVCVHVCTQFTHSYTPHTYLYTLPTYRCSHKLTCMHSHSAHHLVSLLLVCLNNVS